MRRHFIRTCERLLKRIGRKVLSDANFSRMSRAYRRLLPLGLTTERIQHWEAYRKAFEGLRGIEIGGPSDIFRAGSLLPIYPLVRELDCVNFSETTIWQEKRERTGRLNLDPGKPPGRLTICEATRLSPIADQEYDFVLASHVLEHIANPLGAIEEWLRIMVPTGTMLLILPHKDFTFDHRRPVTTMDHLLTDHQRRTPEEDLTHLDEILRLHDLERDPPAGNFASFRMRCLDNHRYRCLHHHVFDLRLAEECLTHFGMTVLSEIFVEPFHQILLARKGERMISAVKK